MRWISIIYNRIRRRKGLGGTWHNGTFYSATSEAFAEGVCKIPLGALLFPIDKPTPPSKWESGKVYHFSPPPSESDLKLWRASFRATHELLRERQRNSIAPDLDRWADDGGSVI